MARSKEELIEILLKEMKIASDEHPGSGSIDIDCFSEIRKKIPTVQRRVISEAMGSDIEGDDTRLEEMIDEKRISTVLQVGVYIKLSEFTKPEQTQMINIIRGLRLKHPAEKNVEYEDED